MEDHALKNHIIKVQDQVLYRLLCTTAGENPDICKIFTVPSTSKAAYSVKGSTIHAALNIPANQKLQYNPLGPDNRKYIISKICTTGVAIDRWFLIDQKQNVELHECTSTGDQM